MPAFVTLPGIDGSGETHWQTLWEARDPRMTRFQPASWSRPVLHDWIEALERAVAAAPEPPILVAHSLACLLVPHWAAAQGSSGGGQVRGAFLVAVPDPDGPAFPAAAAGAFRGVPDRPLPFPALVVASTDDPYGTLDHSRRRAADWGAGLVVAGAFGHVNSASGLGDWPQGTMLLEAFTAGTGRG